MSASSSPIGGVVLDATVAVRPERLDLEPHESAVIEIDVALPTAAGPGRYHGLLLLAGLPDVAYPISVDVADAVPLIATTEPG